ncbi:MAG TPA: hypothetical protein VGJ41_05420 [Nocardioides sp.]|jgi:hypothetical protein
MTAPWFGPSSMAGVSLGLLVESVPFLNDPWGRAGLLTYAGCLLAGVLLMPFGGRIRQFGCGVLASSAAYPIAFLTIFSLFVVLASFD